jgi:LytR cell envelope-related transcriptional attenuator
MTGRYEGPPDHADGVDHRAEAGGPPLQWPPHSGTRVLRAAFVLVAVIVIGVLVLPAATRAPRLPQSAPASVHHPTSPTSTTTAPSTTTTTVPAVAYASITVLVANGTSTAHGAAEVRSWLGSHGFAVSAFPAYDTTTPEASDAIYFVGSGTETMAVEVARALALGPSVVQPAGSVPPVITDSGADVVVVLGKDLATRADAGTLGTAPTSSTSTSSTTTSSTTTTSTTAP